MAPVRLQAERLLSVHLHGTDDSLELAASLLWMENIPSGLEFVCLERNLREAAFKESFTALPE